MKKSVTHKWRGDLPPNPWKVYAVQQSDLTWVATLAREQVAVVHVTDLDENTAYGLVAQWGRMHSVTPLIARWYETQPRQDILREHEMYWRGNVYAIMRNVQ